MLFFIPLGFIFGFLVSAVGVGAGVIMTPLLILAGIPPIYAVGSDLVFSSTSKALATALYGKKGEIHYHTVWLLLLGSLPAVAISYGVFLRIKEAVGFSYINSIIKLLLGAVLVVLSLVYLHRLHFSSKSLEVNLTNSQRRAGLLIIGFIVGLLVFFTSVGSGTLVMAFLIYLMSSPQRLVGTDLAYSFIITTIAALLHVSLGTVNLFMVLLLLIGAIPGTYLGYKVNKRVPRRAFLTALATILFLIGVLFVANTISTLF